MNAKQAKKSRALKRELNNYAKKKAEELNAIKQVNVAEIIALYHTELYRQSFFKRVKHCFRVMQCGESMFNRRTTFYWMTLAGALAALGFKLVVNYSGVII